MKSTGIVRKVDELGRVVLPIELRRTLGIEEKDPVEIYVDADKIILKKYTDSGTREKRDNAIKELSRISKHSSNETIKKAMDDAIELLEQIK